MTSTTTGHPRSRDTERLTRFSPLFHRVAEPLGFDAGDANLYRYVGNSPTNAVDPNGLEEQAPTPAALGPYWDGKTDGQRIWKSERELYGDGLLRLTGRDFVRGFPADLLSEFPRVRIGTEPPPYQCYRYDDTDVKMMASIVARADIRANLMHYKVKVVNQVATILPASLQREQVANLVSDWYIRAVDDFLRTHPGAKPKLGSRNALLDRLGVQDEFSRPWCADWARGMLNASDDLFHTQIAVSGQQKKLGGVLRIKGFQYRSRWYQHNFIGIYPEGTRTDPPSSNPSLLIFDPWINIRPDVFTNKTHPSPPNSEGLR